MSQLISNFQLQSLFSSSFFSLLLLHTFFHQFFDPLSFSLYLCALFCNFVQNFLKMNAPSLSYLWTYYEIFIYIYWDSNSFWFLLVMGVLFQCSVIWLVCLFFFSLIAFISEVNMSFSHYMDDEYEKLFRRMNPPRYTNFFPFPFHKIDTKISMIPHILCPLVVLSCHQGCNW